MTPFPARGSGQTPHNPQFEVTTGAMQRSSPVWLVGAMIAALAGGGALIAGRLLQGGANKQATAALEGDAEKLASAFDSAARAAHMRADGLAATPILRAGIDTDAATMKDIITSEFVFTPAKGEVVEIFQIKKGQLTSLVRLPPTAPPLKPLKGGEVRVEVSGNDALLVAAAPVAGNKAAVAGSLVVSVPVDLTSAKRAVASHSGAAKLVGFGADLPLTDTAAGDTPVRIALPSGADWNATNATLAAAPLAADASTLSWVGPVGYAAFGVAGLFVIIYIASWKRAARERAAERARTSPVA
jgi:hypothetical protein